MKTIVVYLGNSVYTVEADDPGTAMTKAMARHAALERVWAARRAPATGAMAMADALKTVGFGGGAR